MARHYKWIGDDCPPGWRWVGTIDVADLREHPGRGEDGDQGHEEAGVSRRDPDARCGTCGARLAGIDRDHEERCGREAAGWPPFEEEPIHADQPLAARHGAGGATGTAGSGIAITEACDAA